MRSEAILGQLRRTAARKWIVPTHRLWQRCIHARRRLLHRLGSPAVEADSKAAAMLARGPRNDNTLRIVAETSGIWIGQGRPVSA